MGKSGVISPNISSKSPTVHFRWSRLGNVPNPQRAQGKLPAWLSPRAHLSAENGKCEDAIKKSMDGWKKGTCLPPEANCKMFLRILNLISVGE